MLSEIGLPLSIRVWLATQTYDASSDPKTISATTILRPTKSLIMGMRVKPSNEDIDLVQQIPSVLGTAIHTSIESAWLRKDLQVALETAGVKSNVAKKIVVNPETVGEGELPIYMEIRSRKELDGYTISGKFDFVADGVLEDFKSTGTFSWIKQSNAEKYVQQGSIYRWLNPEIITADYMFIRYIFTDWSAAKAKQDSSYPQSRIISQKYSLLPEAETVALLKEKIRKLVTYVDKPEAEIPECTPEDLWQRETVYKYYKNPAKKSRSTKNFDEYHEAHARYIADGSVGEIVEVKGEVVFCKYCNGLSACNQAKNYVANGLLNI